MTTVTANRSAVTHQWSLAAVLLCVCAQVWGAQGVVTVKSKSSTLPLQAYAMVRPIALVHIRTADTGTITNLSVLPGQAVERKQILARLSGSEIQAQLTSLHAQVVTGQSRLKEAEKQLKLARDKFHRHLTTRSDVLKAVAARTQASAHLLAAQAQWRAAHQHVVLRTPVGGSVVKVPVAAGERVHTGQTIAVVQPNSGLWLIADYYGRHVQGIHPGMHGRFTPADGSEDVPVRVVSVGPALQDGGGWPVRLRPAVARGHKIGWISGEAGTVTLNGPHVSMIAVPTRALILDHARWWVMVHTSRGDRPRPVIPGRSSGSMTLIRKGLRAGEKVVVRHAYELYHQHVAGQYTPPD